MFRRLSERLDWVIQRFAKVRYDNPLLQKSGRSLVPRRMHKESNFELYPHAKTLFHVYAPFTTLGATAQQRSN